MFTLCLGVGFVLFLFCLYPVKLTSHCVLIFVATLDPL